MKRLCKEFDTNSASNRKDQCLLILSSPLESSISFDTVFAHKITGTMMKFVSPL